MGNWTLEELGRDVQELKDKKQDKEAYNVWKIYQEDWRKSHDERHTWLIRAVAVVAISTVAQLVFLFIRLLSEAGAG